MTDYPEHKKLEKVQESSQAVGEFMDWMLNEKKLDLARWNDHGQLEPAYNWQDYLYEFFNIDPSALESEKQRMIESLRGSK